MAIKRIQLRGISHTPSDNMSADGGCDESINFFADQQELATADTFSTVGDDVMPSGYDVFEVVFAHKTQSYTNYIYALYDDPSSLYDGAGLYTLDPANTDEPYSKILGFESGEGFDKIEAIGNTLIVLTDRRMLYVFFKDGEYTLLGDQIPEPRITVRAVTDNDSGVSPIVTFFEQVDVESVQRPEFLNYTNLCYNHTGAWDYKLKEIAEGFIRKAMEHFSNDKSQIARSNEYSLPLFVRYAVRLYDGRYVRHSAPILLDPNNFAGINEMAFKFSITQVAIEEGTPRLFSLEMNLSRNGRSETTFDKSLLAPFHILLDIDASNRSEMEKWKDIISSVDVFVSPEINIMSYEAGEITDAEQDFKPGHEEDWTGHSIIHAKILSVDDETENVLAQSNFYKIHSIDIDDYITATESISTKDINDIYGDQLVVKPRLEDDTTRSNDKVRLLTANAYNGRIVSAGAEIEHYQGCYNFPSEKSESTQQQAYSVHFFMRGSDGQTIVVQKNYDASQYSRGPWLFYPDASCYKAVISIPYYVLAISMKEHPYLNGSYCFAGFGNNLPTLIPPASITLNTTEVLSNTIIQSESSNPFFFPLRHEFADKVTSIVPLTIPVSTGQFGYANLYAFTDGGIWTLNIMQDGSIGNVSAVSRDVAKAGSVCQLDQAIAFVSDRGLMLLAGSQIRCLSDKMLSRSFGVSQLDGFADLLREDSSYSHIAGVASDDMTFFDFIKDCAIVYDAAGNRLLMMKRFESGAVKGYCYAYHFDSDTFGKCLTPYASNDKYNFSRALNSYPDAIVTFRKTDGHFVAVNCNRDNSAGRIETTSEHPCPVERCLLITRTINLDETYARKRINDLRIRGIWDTIQPVGSEVRYILYGSMDGTSWQMLSSLRGSSYRFYRIVLLASLKPWDRISWIDIDYTTTFSGRVM